MNESLAHAGMLSPFSVDDLSISEGVSNDQFEWNTLGQLSCHELVNYKDVANQI